MKIIANSLPKSGTHVLVRLLNLLGFAENERDFTASLIRPSNFYQRHINNTKHETDLNSGYRISLEDPIKLISEKHLLNFISQIGDNTFTRGHLPYSQKLESFFMKEGFKILYIIRDPRDVLYSFRNYVISNPLCPLSAIEHISDQLISLLNGFYYKDKMITQQPFFYFVYSSSGWLNSKSTLAIKFEEIIGKKGGGGDEMQIDTIRTILDFLQLPDQNVEELAEKLFYIKSKTFHKGQIGGWKEAMTPELKKVFKEQLGHLLIQLGYEQNFDW